jgi:IS30 family transposase
VSTESIYQHIWKDKKKRGYLSLRTTGKRYRKEEVKNSRGVLSNRRLIEDRPKIVDLKQRLETEIDTIIGKNHKGAIVTINIKPLEY